MADDNENLEKAGAAAVGAAVGSQGSGFVAQTIKGVKLALETKKLYMAAYAILFGVSVGTANMVAEGTAEEAVDNRVEEIVETEIERRKVLEETITTLTNKVTILEEQVEQHKMGLTNQQAELTLHEHDNSGIVALIDLSKETVAPHAHEFVPHSHNLDSESAERIEELEKQIEQLDMALTILGYTVVTHDHNGAFAAQEHEHVIKGRPASDYEHKDPRNDSCGLSCHLD